MTHENGRVDTLLHKNTAKIRHHNGKFVLLIYASNASSTGEDIREDDTVEDGICVDLVTTVSTNIDINKTISILTPCDVHRHHEAKEGDFIMGKHGKTNELTLAGGTDRHTRRTENIHKANTDNHVTANPNSPEKTTDKSGGAMAESIKVETNEANNY